MILLDLHPLIWAGITGLIILSAFFAAAESALFTLSPARLLELEQSGKKSSRRLSALLESPRRLIMILAVGSETTAVGLVMVLTSMVWLVQTQPPYLVASELGASIPLPLLWVWPQTYALAASLLVLLFLARALPKGMGIFFSGAMARAAAAPLTLFGRLTSPLWWVLDRAALGLMRAFGAAPGDFEGEDGGGIRELVEAGSRDGLLDVTERELLVNLLRFGEVTADDIMTPRHEIVSIAADATLADTRRILDEKDYSRMPVHEGERDRIVGVVTAKALFEPRFRGASEDTVRVREVMRLPLFVPGSRRLRDLLLDFKSSRNHLAVVVDEFGALAGLVTMEDVLEEIFGEVREEDEEPEFENLGDNHWRVHGRVEVIEFNTRTGAELPGNTTRTMAGLVLALLARRPRPGDEVVFAGLKFLVIESHGIIINRLEVRREQTP